MTRRQHNNQWIGAINLTLPQNFRMQNSPGKFSPRFLGINNVCSSLFIFQMPNSQSGILVISAGTIEGYFEGKTPRKVDRGYLVLARK
jgi:hypothetical protein